MYVKPSYIKSQQLLISARLTIRNRGVPRATVAAPVVRNAK